MTVIHLGTPLLMCSSNLPAGGASHAVASLFGLAADGGYRVSRPPYGILVSVALFLASRRTAVSRHLALCSPDFPLPGKRQAATVWSASIDILACAMKAIPNKTPTG